MKTLLHILARLRRLQWREIHRLLVLCITALTVSASVTALEMATTSLWLNSQGLTGIGFNYLLAAIGLFFCGAIGLRLERRRGFGSAYITMVLGVIWTVLAYWGVNYPSLFPLMFALKYGTGFLMTVACWALAERYLKLRMTSLKFLVLLTFETIGIACGAWMSYMGQPTEILQKSVLGIWFVMVLFKILGWLVTVPRETFIQKIGGIQDETERIVADTILALSFCWTFLYALTECQVYVYIVQTEVNPMEMLGKFYLAFSGCMFMALILFTQTRFLYTIQFGLVLCAVATGVCGLGGLWETPILIYSGAILFAVTSRFYTARYLSLLARPLKIGKGVRLKKMRWLVMRPCAYVLLGALLLTVSLKAIQLIAIIGMFVLGILFWTSAHLYGRQLMKMCAARLWCGGPLMLCYAPLKQMIRQGMTKPKAAEAIYFLSILNEGNTGAYRQSLIQMLNHPAEAVRLRVLNKLTKLELTRSEKQKMTEMMKTDSCEEVRQRALALLIQDALESQGNAAWHKYKTYLEDKQWLWGACMGFLSGRGAWIEKVVDKVIQLAESKTEKDNLKALSIMKMYPRSEWDEWVGRLLNKQNTTIVKEAIAVAGQLQSLSLLNRLLPMLDEMPWRESVLEALNQYGKTSLPTLEKMIYSEMVPLDRQKELILLLGRLSSGEGKQILLRALFGANRLLRPAIIESLSDSEIVWIHKDRKKVLTKSLCQAIEEWHEMRHMLVQTENIENEKLIQIKTLFHEAIQEELSRTRGLILDQIALYTNVPLGIQSVEVLKSNQLNAYAGAASCLQDMLNKKLYQKVEAVLLYPTVNNPPKQIMEMPVEVFLNRFILNPFRWTNAWLQALALYGWRALDDTSGLVAVQEGLKSKDQTVLEAALSALGKLEKNKEKAEEMALTVPTRYLLKQDFEKLLEEHHVSHH